MKASGIMKESKLKFCLPIINRYESFNNIFTLLRALLVLAFVSMIPLCEYK